ncbi:hypothetical protein CAPN006_19250 [Capnocytophaga canimorsus]|uniref:hypothetical protein n=1 Tax=Capnocytophaga canimorsus TaxID=28188 RepID=UPI001ACC271E|nr:hypothetical protein [Capnocytophaga canimorsus]GIM57533.1 hypothetical protein CAPN006_19250 [Capnocytophaga canimorsus]
MSRDLKKIQKEYDKILRFREIKSFKVSQKEYKEEIYFEKLSIYNKSYKIKPTLSSFILKKENKL